MSNHHDSGYKELFSYPELVRQLIEGFAPQEIAAMMDFTTLTDHSGNYITPLFNEKFEDKVWSVQLHGEENTQQVFVYLLLEFQSTVDYRLPIRLLHYVACFYDHLLKTKATTVKKGMPPIFPVVLYNWERVAPATHRGRRPRGGLCAAGATRSQEPARPPAKSALRRSHYPLA
ncbi:Rpn family recombination-promoting nuclease/putative transposase [Thiorhodospira sibirica]|uniref:Rpn family recombination-promoting nuclease/putative transposase n=1 Tax=Thiorhodospira sibirica TaxID=154347 RepID=UPI00022C588A|nr:Rpn family recombination-promoting nuclease/putative transposase [Thiorhodospira sibirica]